MSQRCTHVCYKHHSTICNEVKKCPNLAVLLEQVTYIFTTCLILWESVSKYPRPNESVEALGTVLGSHRILALILRMNNVRHGRSR